ncbi:MAG TPA: response regulator [Proteobacteria bacterium]|nr:response regulator [Pseudomonadota bacterium]
MVTSGSLKAIGLAKLLADAESRGFTGSLTLKGKTGLAGITLKDGHVVDVQEPRIRSRLGRYLVTKNLITEKELQAALNTQKQSGKGKFLGEILVDQAVLDRKTLDSSMRNVVEDSLVHLLGWEEGLYRVEPLDVVVGDPVEIAPIPELLSRTAQLASAVEEEWIISEILPDGGELENGVRGEILAAVRRVSQKLRELKPQEIVLMVEDEALMREMFKDKLESFGFDVDAVESPQKAIEKLSDYDLEGKLPIVLADLIMPTISGKGIFGGLELLEEIQKTHSHVPVIVNTAYPDPTIRRRALFLGATYYINKPERKDITPDKLENQLNLFIEEVALCIQNVIQRHEIYFEREQQNILREELLSQLIQSREELQKVGELVQRDTGDIRFLRETSDKMVHNKSLAKMAETIVQFAGDEMDRSAIFLIRREKVAGFFGHDRRSDQDDFGDRIRGLNFTLEDSPAIQEAVISRDGVVKRNPGDALGSALLEVFGDSPPEHSVILPLLVQNMVVAVLYCDVVAGGTPPRELDSLEILLNLASMSLEIQQQHAIIQRLRQSS